MSFSVEHGSAAAAAPPHGIDLPGRNRVANGLSNGRTALPLNLHVRKAGAAHFTPVRLNDSAAGDAGAQIEPTANTVAAEPFASFPLGPERMAWATVSFGGKDHRCMLDTGCMTSAWNRSLKPELEVAARAISGTEKYSMPEMAIGSLRVPAGTTGTCVDLDAFSDAVGSQVDGIIGMDVLANVALSLDFDQGVVTLHPASYRPEGQTQIAKMHCMPRPYTAVGVNGQEVLMMVDSGFDGELSLRADFAGAFCERGEAAILLPVRSATLNGARHSRAGLLAQVSLGDCRPERVRFDELSGDPFDGLIGMGFLGRYNVTFRFAQNELVFSKSKWHDAEWWPELCGMKMADVGGRRLVFSVKPGSAAFRAGVRPDDEVQLPRDFLRRWSFGFSQHHSPFHLTWKKAPLQYEDSVPIEWRKPIWPSQGPVAVRVRRPGAADFVVLQLDGSASLENVAEDDGPQTQDGPLTPAVIDAHINRWLGEEHVPGASIAVVKDGKVLFSKGYGLANIERLAQATPQTEYEVFSLSQSLTAMAAMLLVRDGKLSLGDKIGDRLPDLPEAWREVTVRHLLNKRSGIPSYAKRRENGEAFSQGGPREAIAFVARDPLTFQPGEQQGYSHTDYLLLALLIEKATGQPFGEFVTQRILDPLGMSQTRLIDLDRDGDLPQVYWWSKKERQTVPYDGHFRVLYTFASNADDLVKLESALSRRALLDQATIDQMWSSTPPSTTAVGHGFGWQFGTVNGRRWIFAGGSDTGMSRFVDDNLTVIVLTNLRRADVEELSRSIAALFASTLGKQPIDDRDLATTVHLRSVLTDLQRGTSDPADFNANAREQLYLLQAQLASVAALGTLNRFQLLYDVRKDYNTELTYKATFEGGPLMVTFWLDKNAKVDAFSINSVE
ncbi:MAG: serine hydrolase [Pirellulales bacterium]